MNDLLSEITCSCRVYCETDLRYLVGGKLVYDVLYEQLVSLKVNSFHLLRTDHNIVYSVQQQGKDYDLVLVAGCNIVWGRRCSCSCSM